MKSGTHPPCDDVLEAFALDSVAGKPNLEKYLRNYPEYAEAILDFATELSREDVVRKEPLSERENALIEKSWKKHVKAAPKPVADPFAGVSPAELGRVAKFLEIPKQVLTAFRDRTIEGASIPERFAKRLAAEVQCDVQSLRAYLLAPPVLSLARSRKSDIKPKVADRKTFEQILTDAGLAPADRKRLMADD